MAQLPVSFPELMEVMRACGAIRPADCLPNLLRSIIVAELTGWAPGLAAKVRQFDAEQMQALCDYVLAGLKLTGTPAS